MKTKGSFKPGQSGNPGGRGKGLERLVRETVGDDIGAIIKFQAQIALGKIPKGLKVKEVTARDTTAAASFIADRGWGKAKQSVDIHADGGLERKLLEAANLTPEQLEALAAMDVDPGTEPGDDSET